MHLTGVTPVYDKWVDSLSESFVNDIASGRGHFKDLKFAQGMSDKLKVLNLLPEVIESDSFVFNDLSSVKKFNNLRAPLLTTFLEIKQSLHQKGADIFSCFHVFERSHLSFKPF